MSKAPVQHRLAYLAWQYMAAAVLDVYKENECREETGKAQYKARADDWAVIDSLRQDIHDRARRFWTIRTKADPSRFPMSVDAVAILYLRIRKRNKAEIEVFETDIEDACNPLHSDGDELF